MPAAAEADGVRAAGAGFLQLTEEHARSLISSQPIAQLYDVEEEPFARGKYAAVRRCRAAGSGASAPWRYAAKYLRKWRRATDLRPEILHEVAILHACRRSARVVKLFGVFESDQEMVLLLELAEGGELQTLLDRDIVPDEAQVRHLMRQILLGLRDLHDLNVAHLDIKPQNLVLTGEFPNGDVKLCDLGISRYVGEGADVRDMLGTPDYVAPEVLNYEPISLATDMWSVGVLVYVLLTGCSPFGGDTKQETFCNISQCNLDFPEDLFEDVSEEAKDLMRQLMVKEPSKRLTVEQSLRHSWFSATQVPTPIGVVRETGTELSSKNSFREAERMSPVVAVKLEKSSPALSKKMDRPSPTMMRKPGKELPESIKNNDGPPSLPKRTVTVTREVTSLSETSTDVSKPPVTTSVNTSEVNASKEPHEDDEGNMQERNNGGMRSFRKNTFKRNMGSILERVTSCEDFENNNGFNLTSGTNNKNRSNNSSSTVTTNSNSSESNSHMNSNSIITSSINTNATNTNGTNTSKSISSNNTNNNTTTSSHNSNISNSISNSKNNTSHEKITHVSSISFTTTSSMSSNSNSISTSNSSSRISSSNSTNSNTSSISSIYSSNISTSVVQPKNNTVSLNRTLFETNKLSVRFSSSSKKIPAPETPAANSNASIASLIMPRPNRATAMQTMPLGGVREFRLKFELPSSSTTSTMTTTTKAVPTLTTIRDSSTSTVSRTTTTTTLTTTTTSTSSPLPVIPLSAPIVISTTHTSSYNGGSQKNEEKDCVYTFRKCYIVDDGETENGNSLVSDGTNESETSSGYYDNSSCCSSSDSVSDVSETSTDSAGDRLSTASMDSLDSCYGKEKRHYSSTLAAFSLKNNYNKRVNSLKTESVSKTHQSPVFHLAVSTFSHQISENTTKGPSQVEDVEQEKIFAAARRQAAKASHTTVINKVARASFVPATQVSPAVRKECALNITRERNGNEVVLQEVKAGKCSRFSEVKIESVQSRIKKFQS